MDKLSRLKEMLTSMVAFDDHQLKHMTETKYGDLFPTTVSYVKDHKKTIEQVISLVDAL